MAHGSDAGTTRLSSFGLHRPPRAKQNHQQADKEAGEGALCASPHRWQRGQRGPREQFSTAHGFAQEVGCPTVPTEITAFAFVAGLCAA
mmetsp:Transcript_44405/g.141301  ORF Transcript_44405/g.141301 Transcript_44405/m.141301 type:complete len:89 (+) Transcript_44405:228-494(+)